MKNVRKFTDKLFIENSEGILIILYFHCVLITTQGWYHPVEVTYGIIASENVKSVVKTYIPDGAERP